MSMRTTFTTNFIYDGIEGHEERQRKLEKILLADYPKEFIPRNCIGQISGILKGSDLGHEDTKRWIGEQVYACEKITIVPFRIVWMFEGGDIIISEVYAFGKKDPTQ